MPNPLQVEHENAQAEFQPYGQIQIVSTFGEPQAEYAAIRKSAAIFDMPHRGILELVGKDRHPFLNNLLTNQLWDKDKKVGLAAGQTIYAFFLNIKGRIISDMNVIELGERTLLEMDADRVETVKSAFDKYLFAEQVKMKGLVGEMHELFITGPGATELVQAHGSIHFRDDICGVPGYILLLPTSAARDTWDHFTQGEAGAHEDDLRFRGRARPIGWAAFNATRIEAGRALFGIDFDESVLPAETGQFDRAVSITKGCYLGQEIVARMHARGQLARKLVGIRMESDALPVAGTKIYDDQQNEIGGITSSTISPILSNTAICLGIVKRPLFTPGTKLNVPAEGSMRTGVVVELPFV